MSKAAHKRNTTEAGKATALELRIYTLTSTVGSHYVSKR